MQIGAYIKVEHMCQTCGEHFDVEVLAGYAVKYTSPYVRPCVILAESGDPQDRK